MHRLGLPLSVRCSSHAVLAGCAAVFALATACDDDSPVDPSIDAGTIDAGDAREQCGSGAEVVSFMTDDGVSLAADLHRARAPNGAAVVLLHMVPPSNDRSNYPADFIDALTERGVHVLNVDRRGAGASDGEAMDAYIGSSGQLDAKAAIDFFIALPCEVDPSRIGVVGASNGSTTALDYAVRTGGEPGLAKPRALVFLTPGTYTEQQNAIADHRDLLGSLPILFVFSTEERAFSVTYQDEAPPRWEFAEYDPGDHGTRMFVARPESVARVVDFLSYHLRPSE